MRTIPRTGRLLLAVVALLFLVACDEAIPPAAPTIIVGGNVFNVGNQSGPSPAPSASPGSGSCTAGVVHSLRVNPFGYTCPGPEPNNSSGVLPAGCTAQVTATPKDRNGVDVPASLHGPDIVWALPIGADRVIVDPDPSQPFNRNVQMRPGSAPGEFRLEATVCGVTGAWNGRTTP